MQSAGRGGVERPSPAFLRGTLGDDPTIYYAFAALWLTVAIQLAQVAITTGVHAFKNGGPMSMVASLCGGVALTIAVVVLQEWPRGIPAQLSPQDVKHPSLRPGE
jgi:hypothetical protein